MFAYCGNNPTIRLDESGDIWNYVIGAAVNVATTYIAAKVTGQEYTWRDAAVAAISGAANAIPIVGVFLSGAITGTYTGIMASQNGASTLAAVGCGIFAGACTTASIANLANSSVLTNSMLDLTTNAVVDMVFGTGYNSMAAATYKAVTTKTQNNTKKAKNNIYSPANLLPRTHRSSRAVSILERELLLY